MTQIIDVLKERVQSSDGEKNEIYYTPKQKRVLKAIAENPHSKASEIADMAEVHPSYIPYIIERVDPEVVENIHRLEEYFSDKTAEEDTKEQPEQKQDGLMETFGVQSTTPIDDGNQVNDQKTEFTVTREVPVEISIRFPNSRDLNEIVKKKFDEEEEEKDSKQLVTPS